MTPEERALLERTYNMAEDNNNILRSIRRTNRLGTIMHILYWIVILIVSFGAYYFIQPYVALLTGLSGNMSGFDLNSAQDAAKQLQDLLK
ncbi:MAG: hypothetical protein WCV82_01470 [Candidatus Paceibacterota bacterium]